MKSIALCCTYHECHYINHILGKLSTSPTGAAHITYNRDIRGFLVEAGFRYGDKIILERQSVYIFKMDHLNDAYHLCGLQFASICYTDGIEEENRQYLQSRVQTPDTGFIFDIGKLLLSKNINTTSYYAAGLTPFFNPTQEEIGMYAMLYPERFK